MKFTCAVLIVSDAYFNKTATDECGPALAEAIKISFPEATGPVSCTIVPDVPDEILASLKTLCKHDINLILTTGGTILQAPDMATLSRAVVSVKDNSLMINLPGNLKHALESFEFIKSIIPHSINLIYNRKEDSEEENNIEDEDNYKSSNFKVKPMHLNNRTHSFLKKSFDDAFDIVCHLKTYAHQVEEISIEDSLNRVFAPDDALSEAFDIPVGISKMQGFAVISADGKGERILKRSYFTPHHDDSDFILLPGEAVRISVGGCLPKGADAVVPTADTSVVSVSKNEIKIMINTAPQFNQYVKVRKSIQFAAREHITSQDIGRLATLGIFKVKAYKCARVGVLATGDALYSQTTVDFTPGYSRNSNNLLLLNLLKTFGYTANDLGIVKLHPDSLKHALYKAFTEHDVIITTGGVSVGDYEMVKEVLEMDFGAFIHFGRVEMKPGYSTTFATCSFKGVSKYIFSLPGDYDSAMISCRLLVIPALRTYECSSNNAYKPIPVYCECEIVIEESKLRRFGEITLLSMPSKKFTYFEIKNDECPFYGHYDQISESCINELSAILIVPENTEIPENEEIKLDVITLYS